MSVCECKDCRYVREADMRNEVPMRIVIDSDGMRMERMKLHESPKPDEQSGKIVTCEEKEKDSYEKYLDEQLEYITWYQRDERNGLIILWSTASFLVGMALGVIGMAVFGWEL